MLVHQPLEAGAVGRLPEVHDLVDDHVLEQVRRMVDQRDVEPDPAPGRHTAPPAGRHPSEAEEGVPDPDPLAPVREHRLRGGPQFTSLPSVQRTEDGWPVDGLREPDLQSAIRTDPDLRSPRGGDDLEPQRLTEAGPDLSGSAHERSRYGTCRLGLLLDADALAVPLDPRPALPDETRDRTIGRPGRDGDADVTVRRVDPDVHPPDPPDRDRDVETVDLQDTTGLPATPYRVDPGHVSPRSSEVVGRRGLEPLTSCVSSKRSSQLS